MRRMAWKHWLAGMMLGGAVVGCRTAQEVSYLGDADLSHYRNYTQQVEYPAVDQSTPFDVVNSDRPRTIKDRRTDDVWDLSLMEAIQTAVANNKIIRSRQQFLGQGISAVGQVQTASVYDPAIRETGFLFGTRGVEAALADFDTQFTTSLIMGRNNTVQNTLLPTPGFNSTQNTGAFTSGLQKNFAGGGQFAINHNWNYLDSNQPGTLYPSAYSGNLQAQYRHPLWAGSGTEYTRIAGPVTNSFGGITGVTQGVSIARINTDISIADFENNVVTMVRDVEDLYWELYLAYRQYDADVANRDSSLRTWREVKAKMEVGASGGNASAEAQARENYFEIRSRVENSLANIYSVENQFRRLIGLAVNDGRIIRPADNPLEGEYVANWEVGLSEALTRRLELRRQKWQIKSLELQMIAAKSLTNPRLDFVGGYQLNGFGDNLTGSAQDGLTGPGYGSAYSNLLRGEQQAWNAGFQMSMPIGFRSAMAQLRNTELQLMKARAALAAIEQDISHEVADAIQKVDTAYVTARTNLDRRIASERRVEATTAEYDAGVRDATLDLVLRAQASKAAAEISLFTSLVRYNQAITELHLRKGTLLENNNISLAESAWVPEAQDEALRRAWARSHAIPSENLDTEPAEFASPVPYPKTDLTFPGVSTPSSPSRFAAPMTNGVPPVPATEPVPATGALEEE
jgi:outer membrane protein TolC